MHDEIILGCAVDVGSVMQVACSMAQDFTDFPGCLNCLQPEFWGCVTWSCTPALFNLCLFV